MIEAKPLALVTGASSGIGAHIASALMGEGYDVLGIARDFSKLDENLNAFQQRSLDLQDLDSLPKQLCQLSREFPCPDVLICNAGRGLFGSLEEYSFAQIRSLMDLNFLAHVFCVRHFLPEMKRRGSGDILLMGSEAALAGKRQASLYCASKFALRGFGQALRQECISSGIRVTLFHPGPVATPFFDELNFAPQAGPEHVIHPDDVAALVIHVLSSPTTTHFDEIALSPLKPAIRRRP